MWEQLLKRSDKAYAPPQMPSSVVKENKQGYIGVALIKSGKFNARIYVDGQRIYIGCYETPEDAARAYDAVAFKRKGHTVRLNFPNEHTVTKEN